MHSARADQKARHPYRVISSRRARLIEAARPSGRSADKSHHAPFLSHRTLCFLERNYIYFALCSALPFSAQSTSLRPSPLHPCPYPLIGARHTHASKDGRHISTLKNKYPRTHRSVTQAVSAASSSSGLSRSVPFSLASILPEIHASPAQIGLSPRYMAMHGSSSMSACFCIVSRRPSRPLPHFPLLRQEASASASPFRAGRLLWLLPLYLSV